MRSLGRESKKAPQHAGLSNDPEPTTGLLARLVASVLPALTSTACHKWNGALRESALPSNTFFDMVGRPNLLDGIPGSVYEESLGNPPARCGFYAHGFGGRRGKRSSHSCGDSGQSFLLEEAYNQEAGVVQHIQALRREQRSWFYTFTQEWPLGGQDHQFSYTVP